MSESSKPDSEYKVLQVSDKGNYYVMSEQISKEVTKHLQEGWRLYGPPIVQGSAILQAVVK